MDSVNNTKAASATLEKLPSSILFQYREQRDKWLLNINPTPGTESHQFSSSTCDLSLSFLPCYKKTNEIRVEGSYYDILLCAAYHHISEGRVFYVCNPVTGQYVKIPQSSMSRKPDKWGGVGFICHSDVNVNVISFKVLCFPCTALFANQFKMEIFSSDTGVWTESVVSCPQGFRLDYIHFSSIAAPSGNLYWLCSTKGFFVTPFGGGDLDTNPRFIDMPRELGMCWHLTAGLCRGHLRLANWLHPSGEPAKLFVWDLDESTSEWCLVHCVYLKQVVTQCSLLAERINSEFHDGKVIAFHPHYDHIMYFSFWYHGLIALYDMRCKTLELVTQLPPQSRYLLEEDWVFPLLPPSQPTLIPTLPLLDPVINHAFEDCHLFE